MPKYKKIISTSDAKKLFEIVADINSYPEFIPWVAAVRIVENKDEYCLAELLVKYKIFREKYISKVFITPGQEVRVELQEGPFKYLNNIWKFSKDEVEFQIDFEFKSSFFEQMISQDFDYYANKIIEAFDKRLNDTYSC